MFATTIKVKLFGSQVPLEVKPKGDWIDLRSNIDLDIIGPSSKKGKVTFESYLVPLGVAMDLGPGYEAIIASRSSSYKLYGTSMWNGIGVVDNSYNGNNDEWKYGAIGMADGHISKGDRICQFRIQLSQKATTWQRIKWLLSGGKIKFEYVSDLNNEDRDGFGSSGKH